MCKEYRRRRMIPYDGTTESLLTLCEMCVYSGRYGCSVHGEDNRTSIVHGATTAYKRPIK